MATVRISDTVVQKNQKFVMEGVIKRIPKKKYTWDWVYEHKIRDPRTDKFMLIRLAKNAETGDILFSCGTRPDNFVFQKTDLGEFENLMYWIANTLDLIRGEPKID